MIKAPGWRWQDDAIGGQFMDEKNLQRRVHGFHDIRFDGLSDLLMRARGASVLDIGCNRGHLAWDFFVNGARLVHGCDIHAPSIQAARVWFSEIPGMVSRFEVVDLTKPDAMVATFGAEQYDIVLFIGVYHKLIRVMGAGPLSTLTRELGKRAIKYFAFMGYGEHLFQVDIDLKAAGLRRIHTSELAFPGRPAAIWQRL